MNNYNQDNKINNHYINYILNIKHNDNGRLYMI